MRLHLNSAAAAIAAVAAFAIAGAAPSSALTAQECSAKYNAAKAAGTLGETKWNDFRKAQCGEDAKPAEAAKPAEKAADKPAAKAAPAAAASAAVFPKAIDAKYAKESAGKARMHTCRDQYKANKATNGNGGMKWIMKGGGYYSLCNKALKS
ncbi:MAG: hypothetical protein HOP09_07320 [Hyphomicrobium sp.]|nr:hypothetical protein [Hyphomicrobium sp.]